MNRKQHLKLDVITKILAKKISRKLAAKILNVSERTISRYLKAYREKGLRFVYHGNKGKVPKNKISPEIRQQVIHLVKAKYFDFNLTHTIEKLKNDESIQIALETLRRWYKEEGFSKKYRVRSRKITQARQRVSQTGVLLQMDGSYHKWFGGKESCLITAIDDCNNDLYYSGFYQSETTLACMDVLKKIIEKKGKFEVLYVDKAGVYGGGKRQLFSNLKRACEELGIHVLFANSPEAKGRIERVFRTLQDRLIPEMRLAGVKTRSQANRFLEKYISEDYRKKFVISYHGDESFSSIPEGKSLDEVFCIKERRVVNSDHTFKRNGIRYKIETPPCSMSRREIEIRTYIDGTTKFYFFDNEIKVVEFIDYLEVA